MRPIEFKAWDKLNKRIVEVESIDFTHHLIHFFSEPFKGNPSFITDYELIQYTGLKDKHGVKIYEGDILVHDSQLSYEVKYRDFVGAYWLNDFRYSGGLWIDEVDWGYVEVIGNIYENPELLA